MTEAAFRKLALSLPQVTESSHLGRADFRIKKKIFATLPFEGDEDAKGNVPGGVGVLKLTLEQQDAFVEASPACFEPVPGGWGRQGHTRVLLRKATREVVLRAMREAWRNTAGKRMSTLLMPEEPGNRAGAQREKPRRLPRP
ncbi:MAG: MmcQ/YjbR family DNA-binding protein [Phycisphaerales bacterium]